MSISIMESQICGRPLSECLRRIEEFHGFKAPGLVLGLFMVDLAQEKIGADVEADAIVETRYCLPDAIQVFTPCTIGNGWMKILDWDKFAPQSLQMVHAVNPQKRTAPGHFTEHHFVSRPICPIVGCNLCYPILSAREKRQDRNMSDLQRSICGGPGE
ncbi:MAG: formylmethanofuran dehydrogenase subunit E family protein [Deltaproteobacteria bacterium]|nr:formylmethanofuran dehydrogenase subunit E family protein [Deltaproteobacteria bacterium]